MSDLGDDFDAWVPPQGLDSSNVGQMQASLFGEAFLGQSPLFAQATDVGREHFEWLHPRSLEADEPYVYG